MTDVSCHDYKVHLRLNRGTVAVHKPAMESKHEMSQSKRSYRTRRVRYRHILRRTRLARGSSPAARGRLSVIDDLDDVRHVEDEIIR